MDRSVEGWRFAYVSWFWSDIWLFLCQSPNHGGMKIATGLIRSLVVLNWNNVVEATEVMFWT